MGWATKQSADPSGLADDASQRPRRSRPRPRRASPTAFDRQYGNKLHSSKLLRPRGPQMWMSSLVLTIQLLGYLILTHTHLMDLDGNSLQKKAEAFPLLKVFALVICLFSVIVGVRLHG